MNGIDLCAYICGGLWLLATIAGLIWFAWLHHKGKLIGDAPDSIKDIF